MLLYLPGSFSISEHIAVNTSLRAEVLMLTTSLQELKSLNSCLRDEHCALQLAFASLEEKLRKVQVYKSLTFIVRDSYSKIITNFSTVVYVLG